MVFCFPQVPLIVAQHSAYWLGKERFSELGLRRSIISNDRIIENMFSCSSLQCLRCRNVYELFHFLPFVTGLCVIFSGKWRPHKQAYPHTGIERFTQLLSLSFYRVHSNWPSGVVLGKTELPQNVYAWMPNEFCRHAWFTRYSVAMK